MHIILYNLVNIMRLSIYVYYIYSIIIIFRRRVLQLWKERLGSRATYNELIKAFNSADYKQYADHVKNLVQSNDDDSDSSCSENSPSLLQPETYPNPELSSVELPSEIPCETYTLLDSEGY